MAQLRVWATWAKNLSWAFAGFTILALWASTIAGLLLSLAALGAAMLIVSKELIGCLLGAAYLALSRPFKLGDFIEVGEYRGEVVGGGPLSVTLALTGEAHQMTGKVAVIPSVQFLSGGVRSVSPVGGYSTFLVRVQVPGASVASLHAGILLKAATDVCSPWLEQADKQLEQEERRSFRDLPTASPKVLFDLADPKGTSLVLRYTCEPRLRVRTEQEILSRYLGNAYALQVGALPEDKPVP